MQEKPDLTFTVMAMMAISALIFFTHSYFQEKITPPSNDTSTLEERIRPLGQLNIEGADDIKKPTKVNVAKIKAPAKLSGADIYTKSCASCHTPGILNAPKPHNKPQWKPRMSDGVSGLLKSAIAGKGMMPAKGGCSTCSDDELKSVIEFMVTFD